MRLEYSTMEKMTGAFILLTLLIFLFTVAIVGRGKNWFRKHVIYYTTFQEGYNLVSGSRVKLFGTDVGKVMHVELTEDNKVRVRIRILAAYASRIRRDSVAVVESPTVIGSEFINITLGGRGAALVQPGGEISSREKKKFTEYLEEYEIGEKLQNVSVILEDLAQITSKLKDPNGPFFGTMGNLQRITTTVDAGEGSLGRIVKSDELYQEIRDELEDLSRFIASLQEGADHLVEASISIKEGSKNLEVATHEAPDMVDKIQELLDRLVRVSVLLEKAMKEVPDITEQAREGMREVNLILDSVKENFLIRPNLPPPTTPESHGFEIRGEQD